MYSTTLMHVQCCNSCTFYTDFTLTVQKCTVVYYNVYSTTIVIMDVQLYNNACTVLQFMYLSNTILTLPLQHNTVHNYNV